MKIKNLLDNAFIWYIFRWGLDLVFGAYRKRKALLREWDVANGTVLDVACGIGQFSDSTYKGYHGVDLNCNYIERATRLQGTEKITFSCTDVNDLSETTGVFDSVLLIGILHHLNLDMAQRLLATAKKLSREQMIVMEAIQEQTNVFGTWIKNNDRGAYIRHQQNLSELIADAGFELLDTRIVYLGPTRTIATRWRPILPA